MTRDFFAARRDLAAALTGRAHPRLGEMHARIATEESVAALVSRTDSVFADDSFRDLVASAARVERVRVALLDEELRRLLGFLGSRGLAPLVIKGAHLAHVVYPDPLARPRCDTDLLIEAAELGRMEHALREAGYERSTHVRGRVILGQWHFEKRDRTGMTHHLDLHWRAAAPLVVDKVLPAAEVIAAAEPLPALGAGARAPALDDALALACLHVAAHHWPHLELRWAYDLLLLTHAIGAPGRDRFAATGERRRCCTVAARVLSGAADLFDDDVMRALTENLRSAAGAEPSAALLDVTTRAGALWLDLRVAGWSDRVRLLREHLLPDAEYMTARTPGTPLPLAYTVRAVTGIRRWFSDEGRTAERAAPSADCSEASAPRAAARTSRRA